MGKQSPKPDKKMQEWIDARKRHHLSHAHTQMARELGMAPQKMGKMDNHRQESWKAPLPEFIESLYFKHFGKERPDSVITIEDKVRLDWEKKQRKREEKQQRRLAEGEQSEASGPLELLELPREPEA